MEVIGLDGKRYKINIEKYKGKSRSSVSSLHETARCILEKRFPYDIILEEVYIPGCDSKLFLDFLVPKRKLAVEVQGLQHYEFVQHFHGNVATYLKQKRRDSLKREWCKLNSIILVELKDGRQDGWEREIAEAATGGF